MVHGVKTNAHFIKHVMHIQYLIRRDRRSKHRWNINHATRHMCRKGGRVGTTKSRTRRRNLTGCINVLHILCLHGQIPPPPPPFNICRWKIFAAPTGLSSLRGMTHSFYFLLFILVTLQTELDTPWGWRKPINQMAKKLIWYRIFATELGIAFMSIVLYFAWVDQRN